MEISKYLHVLRNMDRVNVYLPEIPFHAIKSDLKKNQSSYLKKEKTNWNKVSTMLKSRGLANRLKLYPTLSFGTSWTRRAENYNQKKKKKTSDDGLRKYRMQSQLVQIYKGLW